MKNPHNPFPRRIRADSGQQRRIRILMAALGIAAFLPVTVRLSRLTVTEFDRWSALARQNQSRTTRITPRRGVIYDRNYHVLADSRTVETVYLAPRELQQSNADIEQLSTALGEILGKDPLRIGKLARDRSLRYHLVADRVEQEQAAQVRTYLETSGIRGIHLEPNTRRFYPYGELAAQVIGFTNASNEGAEGLEASFSIFSGASSRIFPSSRASACTSAPDCCSSRGLRYKFSAGIFCASRFMLQS